MTELQRRIDRLRKQMDREVDKLLAEARAKYVVPYCDKHALRFTAGMGSWSFDKGGAVKSWEESYVWNDSLPKRLQQVLECDVYTSRNDAGSLMEDYTPRNYKEKS